MIVSYSVEIPAVYARVEDRKEGVTGPNTPSHIIDYKMKQAVLHP